MQIASNSTDERTERFTLVHCNLCLFLISRFDEANTAFENAKKRRFHHSRKTDVIYLYGSKERWPTLKVKTNTAVKDV